MSVNVRITQKSIFKRKITIEDIINLTHLSYGTCDENYLLLPNQIANHTLIYDNNKLARGIDLSIDNDDINLLLSLPTSPSEIRTFYKVIEQICHELKVKKYTREGESVSLNDNDKFIKYDETASINGLESLQEKLNTNEHHYFELFGIYNPISIGLKEINQINNNLNNLEDYFHKIQSLDVYYATPKVYKANDQLIGIYVIGPNIPSVVPTKPYIVLNQIQGIQQWYVILKEGKTIKYDDFIANLHKQEYYDANHIIVTLNDDEINNLLDKYSTPIS